MSLEPSLTATTLLEPTPPLPPNRPQHRAGDLCETSWLRLIENAVGAESIARPEPGLERANRPQERLPVQAVAAPLQPPPEWMAVTTFLTTLARSPVPPPSWWRAHAQFQASLETWTDPSRDSLEVEATQEGNDPSAIFLQLTLAGRGQFQLQGSEPQTVGPGIAFVAAEASRVRQFLPDGSPGWTFVRIEISHPYLKSRLTSLIRESGPLFEVAPGDALTASVVRLVRGALTKDFRDQFEAELALFDFGLALERFTRRIPGGVRDTQRLIETQRLINDVRMQVLARLPSAIEVTSLAKRFGMSRSYFSHFFRERTGITPAHFATEIRIQQVETMLRNTCEPLKTIAAACGFANANHLCKVFRRFRHHTPTAFRQSLRL